MTGAKTGPDCGRWLVKLFGHHDGTMYGLPSAQEAADREICLELSFGTLLPPVSGCREGHAEGESRSQGLQLATCPGCLELADW